MDNILILSTVHSLEDARIFYKEAVSIKKKFENVTICIPHKFDEIFTKENITVQPLPIPINRFDRVFRLQYILLRKIPKSRYSIIHFHDPELILLCFILKKIYGIKIIFDVHENVIASIDVRTWIPKSMKKIVSFLYQKLEHYFSKSFDTIIIAEKSYREIYGSRAVEILNYPVIDKNIEIKSKTIDNGITFVYGGNITEVRGIWQILQSFNMIVSQNNKCKLYLVGKIETKELTEKIKNYINQNSLVSNVILTGKVNIHELYDIINNSYLGFALLSEVEHHTGKLPGKIFDYMIWGVPVIVSNFDIYRPYISQKNTGIMVDYNDPNAVSREILNIINDKKRFEEMSANCIRESRNRWTWNEEEKKLLDVYTSLTKSK